MKKKIISILLALCMVLAISGCGGTGTEPAADAPASDAPGTEPEPGAENKSRALIIGADVEATSLAFDSSSEISYKLFQTSCYQKLWDINPATGEQTFELATDYSYDDTNTIMTIHIREGVTFHSGDALTADDILYTLEAIRDGNNSSIVDKVDFENTAVLDDTTIEIHFTEVDAAFFYGMINQFVRSRAYESSHDMTTDACGTGPYMLTAFNLGESIELAAYDGYWGDAPEYDTVTIRFISDEFTRISELDAGNIDACILTSATYIDNVRNGQYADTELHQISDGGVQCLEINITTDEWAAIYSDINLRKALFHAIDVDAIVTNLLDSSCVTATSILPSSCWAYKSIGSYKYDPELAAQYLADAGYAPGELTISVVYQNQGYIGVVWEAIQSYWSDIGVNLVLEGADGSVWGPGMVGGEFPFAIMAAMNCIDPSDAFLPRKIGSGALPCYWKTDELAELDSKAELTVDAAERGEYYDEIQQLVYDGYYVLPLYESSRCWAVKTSVSGWDESLDGLAYPKLGELG